VRRRSRDNDNYLVRFGVATLATWRVSHLLANEDGPGDAVVNLRARLGDTWAGNVMDCFGCTSIWVAAPLSCFTTHKRRERLPTWLALSGAAMLLERLSNDGEHAAETATERREDVNGMLWPEESRTQARTPADR
jgi:hypothetical protein